MDSVSCGVHVLEFAQRFFINQPLTFKWMMYDVFAAQKATSACLLRAADKTYNDSKLSHEAVKIQAQTLSTDVGTRPEIL